MEDVSKVDQREHHAVTSRILIEDFQLVSRSGIAAAARLGVDVDPYARAEKGSTYEVWCDGIRGVRWSYHQRTVGFSAEYPIVASPSPDRQFVTLVCLGSNQYPPPDNALILNADGSVRCQVRQPMRYAGRRTEFLDAWWYYRDLPAPSPPWWAFWRKAPDPQREVRMKMLIGGEIGLPNRDFVALDFNPETGEFGEIVDSGRF